MSQAEFILVFSQEYDGRLVELVKQFLSDDVILVEKGQVDRRQLSSVRGTPTLLDRVRSRQYTGKTCIDFLTNLANMRQHKVRPISAIGANRESTQNNNNHYNNDGRKSAADAELAKLASAKASDFESPFEDEYKSLQGDFIDDEQPASNGGGPVRGMNSKMLQRTPSLVPLSDGERSRYAQADAHARYGKGKTTQSMYDAYLKLRTNANANGIGIVS
jgi:hypothetical protein